MHSHHCDVSIYFRVTWHNVYRSLSTKSLVMLRTIWAYLIYTWGGLHRYFGNKSHILDEHRSAVHYFSQAYEIDPTFRRARLARGVLLGRELGQINEALSDFNALIREDAHYGEAVFNRAMLFQQIGNYKAALADLEAYLALPEEPNDFQVEARRLAVLLRELLDEKKNLNEGM